MRTIDTESIIYNFWERVDGCNVLSLKELCARAEVDYNKVKHNRTDNRLMPCLETLRIADSLGVTMEYLLTGEEKMKTIPPRLQAVVDLLSRDEDKLAAVETLLGIEKKAGSSGIKVS